MKKIYSLIIASAFSVSAIAQGLTFTNTMNPGKQNPAHHFMFDENKFTANKGVANRLRTQTQYWLSYGVTMNTYNSGNMSVLHVNYLFPDSLCFGTFGTTNSGIWIHHIADVLDVKSPAFNVVDGVNWTTSDPFSVDSISILYGYTRHDPDPNVVDTLIVTMFTNVPATNMQTYYYTGETANYGTDTVSFKELGYDQPTNTIGANAENTITATGKIIIKVPLTIADTAEYYYYEKMIGIPGSLNVGAGKLVTTDVQFKPGYSYALGDLIDSQHNAFYFTAYEEKGAGTFPNYFACNMGSINCDYNASSILPMAVRYNMSPGVWNGFYIPSFAYGAGYAYEHHLISYKVTNPPLAVNEIAGNHFSLFQNQPNPFTNTTTIRYQLKKMATEVDLQIYDIRGVKMLEKTEKNSKPGSYTLEINDADFAPGIYFCTLTVDGEKVTGKMVKQ